MRGSGAGLGLDHALGQDARRIEAAADLVGDEGGGTPVAVGQGKLEDAPGLPLELAQALLLGQLLELLEAGDQFLEVGLGEQRGDLALGDGLGASQCCGGEAVGDAEGSAVLAAGRGERGAAGTGEAEHIVRI